MARDAKQDPVDVAGIKVKDQYFSPVETLSSSFDEDPIDGILGLAYPSLSNFNQVRRFSASMSSLPSAHSHLPVSLHSSTPP